MDAEIEKPKTVADFRRIAAPILRMLAQEAIGKNLRRSNIAKLSYDLHQRSLSHMASLEAAGISRRAEILSLQGQVKALRVIIANPIVSTKEGKDDVPSSRGEEGDDDAR